MTQVTSAQATIEETVGRRALHDTTDQYNDTCSFAQAERIFGRDYHGRFVIELLQNAADAWREASTPSAKTDVRIIVESDPPALVVANRGSAFPASNVLDSLGQIGRSSKKAGEAVGHKGIGFKSVLEVSHSPEIYSGLAATDSSLFVRFDAATALDLIRSVSPKWDDWIEADDDYRSAPITAVPTLRYPLWEAEPPPIVSELAADGYMTAIRLPCKEGDVDGWLARVRRAIGDVTDQVLLLLDCFDKVVIDDRVRGDTEIVEAANSGRASLEGGITRDCVTVSRNGKASSRWWMFREEWGEHDLAEHVAVGIRLAVDSDLFVHAMTGEGAEGSSPQSSAPFHLFFPTRIGSGTPFLLHGYFEVDAARTGFHAGSRNENDAILDRLATLAARAVGDTASRADAGRASLVELVASSQAPESDLAGEFLDRLHALLDETPWVPAAGATQVVSPQRLLVANRDVTARLVDAFPAEYVSDRAGRELPDPSLTERALQFLKTRQSDWWDEFWGAMHDLVRPAGIRVWRPGTEDQGFLSFLALLDALERLDSSKGQALIDNLAGDEAARLIPIPDGDDRRLESVPPNPRERGGPRRTALMARRTGAGQDTLQPPRSLDVAFLADGLLTTDADFERARSLGIRPFTVDEVLDRLNSVGDMPDEDWHAMLGFLWRLLRSSRRSEFGTAVSSRRAREFNPAQWFWLRPGRGRGSEADRARQRRERLLTTVRLPAQDGEWRPAGELAFGAAWADWVETHPSAYEQRARTESMRLLQQIAPDPGRHLLASPDVLLPMLALESLTVDTSPLDGDLEGSDDSELDETPDGSADWLEQLSFLLRLGCWETLPLEGHETRTPDAQKIWPWPETRAALLDTEEPPWNFDAWRWGGSSHQNITVTEDARLQWPLTSGDGDAPQNVVRAVGVAGPLLTTLRRAHALCPACGSHVKRYFTSDSEARPSTLELQLRNEAWIPCMLEGVGQGVARPSSIWWESRLPVGAALRTSPLQHLRLALVDGWSPSLRSMCGLASLDEAEVQRLLELQDELRNRLRSNGSEFSLPTSRQAFIGLHRRIYEELNGRDRSAGAWNPDVMVLCEQAGRLVYVPPSAARHDDGRFSRLKSRFAAAIPFLVVARDRGAVARSLGVEPFEVSVTRTDQGPGVDVTANLRTQLTERIPEILAVMVHRGVGGPTLELGGDMFTQRSRRMTSLRVHQVRDLVLEASVVGSDSGPVPLGLDEEGDTYLDTSQPGQPVLYHDLAGTDWADRLRTRLAEPLATLTDAVAYTDTIRLILTADEQGRDELLREWGIAASDVATIRTQMGASTDEDRRQHRAWFCAVVRVAPQGWQIDAESVPLEVTELESLLLRAGLDEIGAHALAQAGGWSEVRAAAGPGTMLPTLVRHGIQLRSLSEELERLEEPPLRVRVARDRQRAWLEAHKPHVVAALATCGADVDEAKEKLERVQPTLDAAWDLDPDLAELVAPVTALLQAAGVEVTSLDLAARPREALAAASGGSQAALDEAAHALYDERARAQLLRRRAGRWRDEIIHLGLLATVAGEGRSAIRAQADAFEKLVPRMERPSALSDVLVKVLPDTYAGLRGALGEQLTDEPFGLLPHRSAILNVAERFGLAIGESDAIAAARSAPRRESVDALNRRARQLQDARVSPRVPILLRPGLDAKPKRSLLDGEPPISTTAPGSTVKRVNAVKVDPASDKRKRQIGDDAESWATAAVVETLRALPAADRLEAIAAMIAFLEQHFVGIPVAAARDHGTLAGELGIDDEDLVDQLEQFVHVSRYSDQFGFDLIGWGTPQDGGGRPLALEVKSSSDGNFLMSAGEWRQAERVRSGDPDDGQYAVLVVRRAGTAVPESMDLLIDPVGLLGKGLERDADSYRVIVTSVSDGN